ncbi:MAG: ribosome biogenesis GTP-binding protein YihA/YsxC [Sandaracinus sp.]
MNSGTSSSGPKNSGTSSSGPKNSGSSSGPMNSGTSSSGKSGPKKSEPVLEILDAVFVAHAKEQDGLPPPMLAEVAFGGRSNVGKSSLINKLVNRRKLVRTSSTPGATRGLSLFRATLRLPDATRAQLDLVDLPGYGFAQRSKSERKSWGPMIEGYLESRVSLRVVVLLVDIRRGLEDDDAQLLEYLAHLGRTTVVAITKIDKVGRTDRDKSVRTITADVKKACGAAPVTVVATSAETGEGIATLWTAIRKHAFLGASPVEP